MKFFNKITISTNFGMKKDNKTIVHVQIVTISDTTTET